MKVVVTGIDEVLEKLSRVKHIDNPVLKGIRELMEQAEVIVSNAYSDSYNATNGNSEFTTNISEAPNGYILTAGGADVGFLEFGAGVFTEADEFANEVDYPVYAGSWSESHEHSENPNARYFAKNGFWWWSNIRYTGLMPTRGMQRALDHLRATGDQYIRNKIEQWIGN